MYMYIYIYTTYHTHINTHNHYLTPTPTHIPNHTYYPRLDIVPMNTNQITTKSNTKLNQSMNHLTSNP